MTTNPFPFDAGLTNQMLDWTAKRIASGPDPKSGAKSFAQLETALGGSVNQDGIGGSKAFDLFTQTIVPSCRPFDHPTSLSFVASAPTPASLGFDAALGAAELFAGNWDGGSGAIHAENQVLGWLAGLAGWPQDRAGGVFVAGGTLGNLSALHAARHWRQNQLQLREHPRRWALLASAEAHSSIAAAARVMDVELVIVPTDDYGRMHADAADEAIDDPNRFFAIVANAGATNCGAVDDLQGLSKLAKFHGLWLHADGAYGLAAMADPQTRPQFHGIEHADSFIVDPHKWLFAPYDACALVYRDAARARAAHGQQAAYLDTLSKSNWNPSDYAIHLTRRARGLPLWFSLAAYGTKAYGDAIAQTLKIARQLADGIYQIDGLQRILGPQLSVILFKPENLNRNALSQWAEAHRRAGDLLCLPTSWHDETVLRLCVVNPATDPGQILDVLRTLPGAAAAA